jgi:hypothetical protein
MPGVAHNHNIYMHGCEYHTEVKDQGESLIFLSSYSLPLKTKLFLAPVFNEESSPILKMHASTKNLIVDNFSKG